MSTTNDNSHLVDDLAAHWTDAALEILRSAGIRSISVDLELDIWRNIKRTLNAEVRWQRAFRYSTLVSLSTLREHVLHKTTLPAVRMIVVPELVRTIEDRVRSLVRVQRTTAAEARIYDALVRQPALHAAFKPPTRTDYFPRLHATIAG